MVRIYGGKGGVCGLLALGDDLGPILACATGKHVLGTMMESKS